MSNNTLNSIDARNNLVTLAIRWVQGQSGSDYIFLLDSDAISSLRLGARHEIALAAVAAMEAQDVRDGFLLPSRKVATVTVGEDGTATWSYKIGWGGTEVQISAEGAEGVEVVVKSFYYDEEKRERILKGSVVLFEDDRGVRAAWWTKEGDHSFARLKWLLEALEQRFEDVVHSGHIQRVRDFVPLAATNGW